MPDVVLYAIAYIVGYLISVRLIAKLQLGWSRRHDVKWNADDDLFCVTYGLVWPFTLPIVTLLYLPEILSSHSKNHRPLAKLTGVKDER